MIVSQAFNLRDNWARVSAQTVLTMIREDRAAGVDQWTVKELHRVYSAGSNYRCFIASSEAGSLYFVSLTTRQTVPARIRDLEHIAALHGGRVYPGELEGGPGIHFSQDRGADVCDVITTAVDCGLVGAQVSPVPRGFIVCWPHLQGVAV